MARIAFLQRLWTDHLGVMTVSAAARARGHDTRLFVWEGPRTLERLRAFAPQVVGFPVTTGAHPWVLRTALRVREERRCVILVGGPHATFFPEVSLHPAVDAACVGEGEEAVADLGDRLDRGEDWRDVQNLAFADRGALVRNPLRPLVADLDTLPLPDREYYDRHPFFARRAMGFFVASRGCPHACTFCFNGPYRRLVRGRGPFVRRRSPTHVLAEVLDYRRRFRLERVCFEDDSLVEDRAWLERFLDLYAREVRLPFHCNVRADEVDPEVASALRDAGCASVAFGIETGSETLRRRVLRKRLADDRIRAAAEALRGAGIRFKTYNILGLPGETLEDAWRTVTLNQDIGTDFPWCSVFTPYPRTDLGDSLRAAGRLDGDWSVDRVGEFYLGRSILDQPDLSRVVNLQKFFPLVVRHPGLRPIVERLIRLPPNPGFDVFASLIHFYYHMVRLFDMEARELVELLVRTTATDHGFPTRWVLGGRTLRRTIQARMRAPS